MLFMHDMMFKYKQLQSVGANRAVHGKHPLRHLNLVRYLTMSVVSHLAKDDWYKQLHWNNK